MRSLVLVVAATLALQVALAQPARAQAGNPYLSAALRLYGDMEYESALDVLRKAQAKPDNSLEDDVRIRIYLGLVQLELGNGDEAESAFKAALALDPSAALPKPVAPKAETLFAKAQKDIAKRKVPTTPTKPPEPVVAKPPEPAKPPPTIIVVPPPDPDPAPGRTTTATVVPLDPPRPDRPPEVARGTSTRTVALAIGVPLLAAGVGLLGGGAFFGSQASSARTDADDPALSQVDAQARFQSAQSSATNANLLFGIGAAVAVAGIVTVIVAAASGPDAAPSAPPSEMPGTR